MSDAPRTDALYMRLTAAGLVPHFDIVEHARQLERELANEQIVRRAYEARIEQLERELNTIIARAKAECAGWNCNERLNHKDEWCPNCPYELVTRKDG